MLALHMTSRYTNVHAMLALHLIWPKLLGYIYVIYVDERGFGVRWNERGSFHGATWARWEFPCKVEQNLWQIQYLLRPRNRRHYCFFRCSTPYDHRHSHYSHQTPESHLNFNMKNHLYIIYYYIYYVYLNLYKLFMLYYSQNCTTKFDIVVKCLTSW